MKRSLSFKLILCYIIAAFSVFCLTNTLGTYLLNNQITATFLNNMKITSNAIIGNPTINAYLTNPDEESHLSDIIEYFNIVNKTTDIQIWLLDKDGNFIYTSNNNSLFEGKNIAKYYPRLTFLDSLDDVYIKKLTPSKSLCKISKLKNTTTKEIDGYLVLSVPKNIISERYSSTLYIVNIIAIALCAILAVIFILIYFLTIQPIHQLTDYAVAITQGNISKKINIKSNDEYRDLASALSYLSNELNNLDEYQRKFISNISHDFRSPLTSIKGYLEAMLDGTIPPEGYDKFIKIILFEAERLTNLTTNLLTLNKLDGHKQMLDKTSFDINYIISKTIEVYEGRCEKQKIKLIKKFENIHQYVYADQSKIQQVINNLLDNAIKFSSANTSIIISTYLKSEKVFISIKDHGAGIPKKNINHIWERFYKIDSSRGKDKRGTGLGLAITKEIINAHNENINVTSTEGVGTEFTFSLPKRNN